MVATATTTTATMMIMMTTGNDKSDVYCDNDGVGDDNGDGSGIDSHMMMMMIIFN